MTGDVLEVAFKEWSAVVEALGNGQQSVILRKGGIHEKGGRFSPAYSSFLFFPTFEHQNKEDIRAEFLNLFAKENKEETEKIAFEYFAKLEKSWEIRNLEQLLGFSSFHIWSEEVLRKRFEFGKEKGVFLMLVRIYRLPAISYVENQSSYGGCKSWGTLKNEESI